MPSRPGPQDPRGARHHRGAGRLLATAPAILAGTLAACGTGPSAPGGAASKIVTRPEAQRPAQGQSPKNQTPQGRTPRGPRPGGGTGTTAATTTTPTTTTATTTATTTTTTSAGTACALKGPAPGIYQESFDSAGSARTYVLEVPTAAATGAHLPLVVSFHGYGKTAAEQEAYTQLSAYALHQGVFVVTPDGLMGQWNFVRRPSVGPSDVAFIASLLGALSQRICYDPKRVVATGISDGADMANTFGCAFPDLVAAVFAVAPSIDSQDCPLPAASMIEVHGTADPIVPFDGGGGDRPYPFQGTEAVAAYTRVAHWAALDKCATSPSQDSVAAGVWASVYACPAGRQVALYVIEGGGHTWPGAAPIPSLGPTSTAVSADQAVLSLAKDPRSLPW